MKRYILLLGGLFILGLSLGLITRPGSEKPHRQDTLTLTRTSSAKARPHGNSTPSISNSTPDTLTQITKDVGYFGYSESERERLLEALTAWYLESPANALAWIKSSSAYPELVNKLIGELVIGVSRIDFNKGLELAESEISILKQIQPIYASKSNPFSELSKLSISHGSEAVFQVAELGVGYPYHSIYCKFPDGFDFQTTLNGLADLNAAQEEGQELTVLPSNLLSGWAKQDPEAAWKWLQEGRKLRENDTKLEYFRGYRERVSPYELGQAVGSYMGFDEDGSRNLVRLLSRSRVTENTDILQGYVSAADSAERTEVVAALIRESGDYANEWGNEIRTALLSKLDPSTRLNALKQALGDLDSSERAGMKPLLLEMGHTEEELDELYREQQ